MTDTTTWSSATGEPTPRTLALPSCWPCRPCTTTSSPHANVSQIAVIVEAARSAKTMHVALLMGYGASGVTHICRSPSSKMTVDRLPAARLRNAAKTISKALKRGMLKIMSKMGNRTIRSYRGAALLRQLGVGDRCYRCLFQRDGQ